VPYTKEVHSRYTHNSLVWVDLESPTHGEVQSIAEEFGIDHHTTLELALPTTKPSIEFYPTYAYAIFHFPALRHTHQTLEQEIDFVIGKKFLITAHYDTIDSLHKFSKVFEANTILKKETIGNEAVELFFYVLKKMYRSVEHELEAIRRDLFAVEEHIFSGKEVEMVSALSRSARDLLNVRQTLESHRDILKNLETEGSLFFGETFTPYFRALSGEYHRVYSHCVRQMETLHELRETNNSLLSTKENQTTRILAILALFTFPLSLLVGLLSVESVYNPIMGTPYDFWIIVGILVVTATSMRWYFKNRGWL